MRLRRLAWVAACLCGLTQAQDSLSALPELDARERIAQQAAALYATKNFDEIDARADAYLTHETRTSSGLWISGLFEDGIIEAVPEPSRTDAAAWDALERDVRAWTEQRPQSAVARLLLANTIRERGWRIRGGGYANTVPADAWQPFHAHLSRARDYLLQVKSVASRDPWYYQLLVDLDNGLGADEAQVQADFQEGVTRFPGYYPLYFEMLNHLMPKWHGSAAQIEAFAKASVERTRATEGDGMYARIYWFAAQNGYDDTLFTESFARWSHMRVGFEDVIARYPDQWNLQNYAHFACEVGDMATLKSLLPRLSSPIDQVWGGSVSFDACQRLAGRITA